VDGFDAIKRAKRSWQEVTFDENLICVEMNVKIDMKIAQHTTSARDESALDMKRKKTYKTSMSIILKL
jgi:hypothetical protein